MGQAGSIGVALYNVYRVAKLIVDIVDVIVASHIRDNPTMGNIVVAKDGNDYVQRAARVAAEEAAVAPPSRISTTKRAQLVAEANLALGIQPIVIPTPDVISAAKARVQYQDGLFHFAVAGIAGSGKSSLINAFRGLRNNDAGAAPTGVIETTSSVDRYPDPNPKFPFVWYDIPGAGTITQSDWLYFNTQGLFVFDCIIVLLDNRLTRTDLSILANSRRFQIPTYIVRSKADVHIRNIMDDMSDDGDDIDETRSITLYNAARDQHIADTLESVKNGLREGGLPNQRVYVVSHRTLMSTVKNRVLSQKTIHELELIRDLLEEACTRRCSPNNVA